MTVFRTTRAPLLTPKDAAGLRDEEFRCAIRRDQHNRKRPPVTLAGVATVKSDTPPKVVLAKATRRRAVKWDW